MTTDETPILSSVVTLSFPFSVFRFPFSVFRFQLVVVKILRAAKILLPLYY